MKRLIIIAATLFTGLSASAQDDPKIKVTGYIEMYYGYDFNKPENSTRPGFIYSHNRSNEVNLNLGFIKANYDSGTVRANLALMAGTYTIWKGPLKDNKGKEVIGAGTDRGQKDPELEKMDYLIEGVIGATS